MKALITRARRWLRGQRGRSIPFAGWIIIPCDPYGNPVDGEEADYAAHEVDAFGVAWLGFGADLAYGEPRPRAVDPNDPKRYAPGDVFQ